MSKRRKRSYTHLDIEARKAIERSLNEKRTLSYIATELDVTVSTVRREIVRNRSCEFASTSKGADRTDCIHLGVCKRKSLCAACRMRLLCKRCITHRCNDICPDYEQRICKVTERSPFTCNSCERYGRCTLIRYRYSAEVAHAAATRRSAESRNGADITREELDLLEETVRAGLKLGQAIHHIFATNELPVSERTFYRYVEDEVVKIKSIELAKKVKYKKRKKAKKASQVSGCYAGQE
jgi:IS30 family transposase